MKGIKIIITIITTITIILSCAYAEQDRGEFYPLLTIVVDINDWEENVSVVSCQDKTGNIWCFFDEGHEWEIGDIANLLMWNMGSDIEEDEIVEIYWEGYIEDIDSFFQIEGWH